MIFDDNTIYILDSYGLIFRCYFAFISRPLINQNGENVSALFGFFRNLHWILEHYKPKYLFAAMDSKTKTFRHEMYKEYKATRNKTPDDLHAQIPWIEEVLNSLGIPVLQCDGYEADDIIATVAKKCEEQNRNCRILSGDKDLMQLVTDNCQILKPETGASTWKITGKEAVLAEWGVPPEQLLDLLSLYGDTADNIPGVHGVGVKTAAKLLSDYNNIDGIYKHINEIKGAMKQKLIDGKENAYFSQKLIRLFNEVPCPKIDEAINSKEYIFNYKKAAQVLEKYGVPNVAKSYENLEQNSEKVIENSIEQYNFDSTEEGQISLKENDTSSYKAITKIEDLESYITEYLNKASKSILPIAYDSETTDLDTFNCRILGFSLCYEKGKAVYVPIQQTNEQDLFSNSDYISKKDAFSQLQRLFSNSSISVIMHNAKYDLKVLINNDFAETDIFLEEIKCEIIDTMIISWLSNPERTGKNSYSLEYLGETVLGLKGIEFSDLVQKGQTFEDVPLEKAYKYAAEDADFTLQLFLKQKESQSYKNINQEFIKNNILTEKLPSKSLLDLEMKILPVLTQMEINGIHINSSLLNDYNKELSDVLSLKEKEIYTEVGHEFNISSPKQLQTVLFEERHLTPGKKTKTGYSTDTSVLEELSYEDIVPKMILEYRELAKLQSTYVQTLPSMCDKNERIHTDFIQTGTSTGRLSCREPNLQNIPVRSEAGRKIRSAFTAPEGKVLISADYSQIELVVLAHLSGDKNMSNSFIKGTDVHKATASLIYQVPPENVTPQMRRTAKTINFGVIYGMSSFRLAKDLGISRTQASNFINNYFEQYSSIKTFIEDTIQNAEKNGYVKTILGRQRKIISINSKNKIEKNAAERMAVNTPVQGSAADIVKIAMIKISNELKKSNLSAKLLLQVHDELIFECQDNPEIIEQTVNLIRTQMENAVKLSIPLSVSIEYGKNWGDFH